MVCKLSEVSDALLRRECSRINAEKFTIKRSTRIDRIDPNPRYNLLPIVIFKLLDTVKTGRIAPLNPAAGFSLILEVEFDDFRGFLWPRLKFPILQGLSSGLDEQRTAANGPGTFHMTIGFNSDFDFDLAGDVHLPGERRKFRNDAMDDFPLSG